MKTVSNITKVISKLLSDQDSSIGDLITQFKSWVGGKDKEIESVLVI